VNGYLSLGLPPRIDPPYPAWPPSDIGIMEDAIIEAMRRLRMAKTRQAIAAAQENQITEWLEDHLVRLLDAGAVDGYVSDRFEQPARSRTVNYDDTKISKEPDLTFKRQSKFSCARDRRQDAWFCECKILDAGSSHGLSDYIKDGLMRFVVGDYAWAMPQAQMIGYVRHAAAIAYAPATQLPEHMARKNPKSGLGNDRFTRLQGLAGPETAIAGAQPIFTTRHERTFRLRNNRAPGSITLRHLWFQMT